MQQRLIVIHAWLSIQSQGDQRRVPQKRRHSLAIRALSSCAGDKDDRMGRARTLCTGSGGLAEKWEGDRYLDGGVGTWAREGRQQFAADVSVTTQSLSSPPDCTSREGRGPAPVTYSQHMA